MVLKKKKTKKKQVNGIVHRVHVRLNFATG